MMGGFSYIPTTRQLKNSTQYPAGEIAASSVFTYKTSADATLGTYTTGAANTVEVNKIYNLGAMMGTLPGLFTIDGSGNRVQFSKGNLQATCGVRYAEVKVNSICGMLVFPDTFTWPAGITTDKPSTFNTKSSNWNGRDYTAAEFTLLESAGCVFLPTAGYRDGSVLSMVDFRGYYWSYRGRCL